MPAPLTEKLMEFPDPLYVDVILKHNRRIILNLFADRVPTTRFWATTLNILPVIGRLNSEFILGIQPVFALTTFQHSGFKTHFTFWNSFMGPNRGQFLDTYGVMEPYSTCSYLEERPSLVGFFGYCTLRETKWFATAPRRQTLDGFYLDRLRTVSRNGSAQPHFFASHYQWPGHTATTFRRTEQEVQTSRSAYRAVTERADNMMDNLLDEIQNADPDAIVFVFGDHGSYISRGIDYADDPGFVVQALHGILGAVFGADACMPFLHPPRGEKFQTSSRIVAGLLQCLSGGESILKDDYDFGKINAAPGNMRFEDYVYE